MTVEEFFQAMLLILCMLATGVILPVGMAVSSAPQGAQAPVNSIIPVFVYDET